MVLSGSVRRNNEDCVFKEALCPVLMVEGRVLRSRQHPWLLGGSGWNRLFCCVTASCGCASWAPAEERRAALMCAHLFNLPCSGVPSGPWPARMRGLNLAHVWHRALVLASSWLGLQQCVWLLSVHLAASPLQLWAHSVIGWCLNGAGAVG